MVGDYVLWSRVDKPANRENRKLLANWTGPYQVTDLCSFSGFKIRNLINGSVHEAHASRLSFFAHENLHVTSELREHISLQGLDLEVELFKAFRYDKSEWKLLVKWLGFEDSENTWENALNMLRDVPHLVKSFIDSLDMKFPCNQNFKNWYGKFLTKEKRGL